jgi:hypothetical protein
MESRKVATRFLRLTQFAGTIGQIDGPSRASVANNFAGRNIGMLHAKAAEPAHFISDHCYDASVGGWLTY